MSSSILVIHGTISFEPYKHLCDGNAQVTKNKQPKESYFGKCSLVPHNSLGRRYKGEEILQGEEKFPSHGNNGEDMCTPSLSSSRNVNSPSLLHIVTMHFYHPRAHVLLQYVSIPLFLFKQTLMPTIFHPSLGINAKKCYYSFLTSKE